MALANFADKIVNIDCS